MREKEAKTLTLDLCDHYIVCGMGHVGYRIALLLPRLGLTAVVIYDHAPEEWLLEARAAGIACLEGDARSETLLRKAGVQRARGIIAATDQDMANLSIALDSLRLNSGIAVAVRLYDQELARHLEDNLKGLQVLSASALAAPVFVAAALGHDAVGCFEYAGKPYVIEAVSGALPETSDGLRLLFQATPDGTVRVVDSPQDAMPGDRLVLRPAPEYVATAPPKGYAYWREAGTSLLTALRAVPWGVRALFAILLALILIGIAAVHFSLALDYLDAFYLVVTTVTTTGYGDLSFRHAPPLLKLFGCFLMLSGAALLALIFGIITDALISRRFQGLLNGHPVRACGHTIVAGSGHGAFRMVEELLQEGHQPVAVCPGGEHAAALQGLHVPVIEGDARVKAVLDLAGITTAAAVISAHDDDVVNLGIGLLARKLNPAVQTVVRVFDGALAAKLQVQLGLDRVLSVSAVSAPAFVAAALYGPVIQALIWHDCLVVIRRANPDNVPARGEQSLLLGEDFTSTEAPTPDTPPAPVLEVILHQMREPSDCTPLAVNQ